MSISRVLFNPTPSEKYKTFIYTLFIRGIPNYFGCLFIQWVDCMKHTRFEKARIIGARALQITMGAPPLISDMKGIISPVDLAEREYRKGIIPINALRDI
jgi:DNA-directed RNA polymerase subunit K